MKRVPRAFSLAVIPDEQGDYAVELLTAANGRSTTLLHLRSPLLDRIRPAVLSAVVASKHPRTVLSPTRKAPIGLTEDAGVRLSLVALASAPLRKVSRVEAIKRGVESMTNEEALYWFALVTGPNANRALQALRLLLAEE